MSQLLMIIDRSERQGDPPALRLWHLGATLREHLQEAPRTLRTLETIADRLRAAKGAGYATKTLYAAMQVAAAVTSKTAADIGRTAVLKQLLALDDEERQFYIDAYTRLRPPTRRLSKWIATNLYGRANGRVGRAASLETEPGPLSQSQITRAIEQQIDALEAVLKAQRRRVRQGHGQGQVRLRIHRDRRGRWSWVVIGPSGRPTPAPPGLPTLTALRGLLP